MYDERLAQRVRVALAAHDGISERKMFGGLAFMLDGKMRVRVMTHELVVRVGAEHYLDALKSPHARPMDFTGRPMRGMVYVSPAGVTRGAALRRWVDAGLAAASEAPARARAKRKGGPKKKGVAAPRGRA